MIYADNAATTELDPEAFEVMKQYLLAEYGNASQPYSFSRSAKIALMHAREIIASCINADPEEIFFTSGGTESDNWAVKGTICNDRRAEIIISQIEHHAILNACAAIERLGGNVVYLPVDRTGIVMPDILRRFITNNTKLVSVMLVNNEIGTIEPIAELAKIAHKCGALFHTDAVQAIGHIPVDVKALGVDMLSASGHKFNAPKGTGFIYIKKGTLIDSYINGGSQEFGKRAGTENVAAIAAMAKALENNCSLMTNIDNKLKRMEDEFIREMNISGIDYIRNGSEMRVPGNINISIKGASGEMLMHRLDLMGIYISTGSACDSHNNQISHVIKAIEVPDDYAEGTVRISFGRNNNEKDAVEIAKAMISILKNKRNIKNKNN